MGSRIDLYFLGITLTRCQEEREAFQNGLVMKSIAYTSVCRLGNLCPSSLLLPKWRSLAKPQTDVVYSGKLPDMLSFEELCLDFIIIFLPPLGAYIEKYLSIWKTWSLYLEDVKFVFYISLKN